MFWNIVYYVVGGVGAILVLTTLLNVINNNPHKKIDFYEKAEKENCIALGKLSCYLLVGTREFPRHRLEYCYLVNDKPYYKTISIDVHPQFGKEDLEDFSPSQLIEDRDYSQMMIYYDKANPSRSLIKEEIFTSKDALKKERTPKHNRYRDIQREWISEGPVDLIDWEAR